MIVGSDALLISHNDAEVIAADLFASRTTRAQIEKAKDKIAEKGVRIAQPNKSVQVYERRMKVNGMRANYRVVVNNADDTIVTMFPALGGS